MRICLVALTSVLLFNSLLATAQDWPDWRGINRNGVWEEKIDNIESFELLQVWSQPLGSGYSGPTVAEGKVYVTDLKQDPQTEGIICFNENTGEKMWEYRYECLYEGVGYPAGPRASVVFENNLVWSLGTMGHLHCFDATTGSVKWQKDLRQGYAIKMPVWGIAATPLIHEEKIILQIGGAENAGVIALDKSTGTELWRSLNDLASYSAPVVIEKNGKQVLVVWTENHLAGMSPQTGEVYWKFPFNQKMGMAIATPVLSNNYLFVSSFYNGSLLVQLGEDYTTAEKVWQRCGESERNTDALHCVMNTPVILGQYIYGIDSYGELRCLDLKTGDRIWEDLSVVNKNRWANVHFIQNGDKTLMFNEHGELLVTQLSPGGVKEFSRNKIIEPTKKQLPRGVTWAHPALANGHVIVRSDDKIVSLKFGAE